MPGAHLTVLPSLCSLSFVFLEDRAFIFLPRDQGRVGALGAWHCARDLGREGWGRGLGEAGWRGKPATRLGAAGALALNPEVQDSTSQFKSHHWPDHLTNCA